MGHVASKISFSHAALNISFSNVYMNGVLATWAVIGVSNLYSSFVLRKDKNNYDPMDSLDYIGHSIIKAMSYGCIWPLFFPHAIAKAIVSDRETIDINGYKFNRNGILSHLIPVSLYFEDQRNKEMLDLYYEETL